MQCTLQYSMKERGGEGKRGNTETRGRDKIRDEVPKLPQDDTQQEDPELMAKYRGRSLKLVYVTTLTTTACSATIQTVSQGGMGC